MPIGRLARALPRPRSKAGRIGVVAAAVVAGLVALDLIALVATLAYGSSLLAQ